MERFESGEQVLLTGAGFTANFGAPLAREMWAEIFNHPEIQTTKRRDGSRPLRETLLNDFDFEGVYHRVMRGRDFTPPEREALTSAIIAAYEQMDVSIGNYAGRPIVGDALARLGECLSRLGEQSGKGFIFTLNQDLFIERYFPSSQFVPELIIPGIAPKSAVSPYLNDHRRPLTEADVYRTPANVSALKPLQEEHLRNGQFFYVKLHGSWNWRTAEGQLQLVLGRDKENAINRNPLLQWYLELFRDTLCQPNKHLWVIGYSFRDSHINRVIIEGVQNHDLSVYIINPVPVDIFLDDLFKRETELYFLLRKSLSAYYPHTLDRFFPKGSMDVTTFKTFPEYFSAKRSSDLSA